MPKTLLLFAAVFLFLLIGCSNKDKDPCSGHIPCALTNPRLFHFSIKDKSTGQDLFFSTSPSYPFSALKVIWTGGGTAPQPQVDTLTARQDFVMVAAGPGVDTFYFKIADTKSDTLVYTAKTYQAGCCLDSTVLTNMSFNGQPIPGPLNLLTADNSTVLVFYK